MTGIIWNSWRASSSSIGSCDSRDVVKVDCSSSCSVLGAVNLKPSCSEMLAKQSFIERRRQRLEQKHIRSPSYEADSSQVTSVPSNPTATNRIVLPSTKSPFFSPSSTPSTTSSATSSVLPWREGGIIMQRYYHEMKDGYPRASTVSLPDHGGYYPCGATDDPTTTLLRNNSKKCTLNPSCSSSGAFSSSTVSLVCSTTSSCPFPVGSSSFSSSFSSLSHEEQKFKRVFNQESGAHPRFVMASPVPPSISSSYSSSSSPLVGSLGCLQSPVGSLGSFSLPSTSPSISSAVLSTSFFPSFATCTSTTKTTTMTTTAIPRHATTKTVWARRLAPSDLSETIPSKKRENSVENITHGAETTAVQNYSNSTKGSKVTSQVVNAAPKRSLQGGGIMTVRPKRREVQTRSGDQKTTGLKQQSDSIRRWTARANSTTTTKDRSTNTRTCNTTTTQAASLSKGSSPPAMVPCRRPTKQFKPCATQRTSDDSLPHGEGRGISALQSCQSSSSTYNPLYPYTSPPSSIHVNPPPAHPSHRSLPCITPFFAPSTSSFSVDAPMSTITPSQQFSTPLPPPPGVPPYDLFYSPPAVPFVSQNFTSLPDSLQRISPSSPASSSCRFSQLCPSYFPSSSSSCFPIAENRSSSNSTTASTLANDFFLNFRRDLLSLSMETDRLGTPPSPPPRLRCLSSPPVPTSSAKLTSPAVEKSAVRGGAGQASRPSRTRLRRTPCVASQRATPAKKSSVVPPPPTKPIDKRHHPVPLFLSVLFNRSRPPHLQIPTEITPGRAPRLRALAFPSASPPAPSSPIRKEANLKEDSSLSPPLPLGLISWYSSLRSSPMEDGMERMGFSQVSSTHSPSPYFLESPSIPAPYSPGCSSPIPSSPTSVRQRSQGRTSPSPQSTCSRTLPLYSTSPVAPRASFLLPPLFPATPPPFLSTASSTPLSGSPEVLLPCSAPRSHGPAAQHTRSARTSPTQSAPFTPPGEGHAAARQNGSPRSLSLPTSPPPYSTSSTPTIPSISFSCSPLPPPFSFPSHRNSTTTPTKIASVPSCYSLCTSITNNSAGDTNNSTASSTSDSSNSTCSGSAAGITKTSHAIASSGSIGQIRSITTTTASVCTTVSSYTIIPTTATVNRDMSDNSISDSSTSSYISSSSVTSSSTSSSKTFVGGRTLTCGTASLATSSSSGNLPSSACTPPPGSSHWSPCLPVLPTPSECVTPSPPNTSSRHGQKDTSSDVVFPLAASTLPSSSFSFPQLPSSSSSFSSSSSPCRRLGTSSVSLLACPLPSTTHPPSDVPSHLFLPPPPASSIYLESFKIPPLPPLKLPPPLPQATPDIQSLSSFLNSLLQRPLPRRAKTVHAASPSPKSRHSSSPPPSSSTSVLPSPSSSLFLGFEVSSTPTSSPSESPPPMNTPRSSATTCGPRLCYATLASPAGTQEEGEVRFCQRKLCRIAPSKTQSVEEVTTSASCVLKRSGRGDRKGGGGRRSGRGGGKEGRAEIRRHVKRGVNQNNIEMTSSSNPSSEGEIRYRWRIGGIYSSGRKREPIPLKRQHSIG